MATGLAVVSGSELFSCVKVGAIRALRIVPSDRFLPRDAYA